jgi:hypothetical protein
MSSLEGPKRDMQIVVIALLIGMTVGITGINIYIVGFEDESEKEKTDEDYK